jgi:beta-glucanase (GH16 family)
LAWPGDDAAWPGDPGLDSPWGDDSAAHGTGPGAGEKRPSRSKSAALKRSSSMRSALMVVGILGAVVVLAVGLVALTVLRGGSNGTAAANVTNATAGASASGTASASHSATASPKASAKAKAKAKASAKKTAATSGPKPAAALLTVPAGWKLAFDPSFSGTQLSTGTWATCYDWATSPSIGCTNNPTKEKEWYVPSQVNVSGGTLNLVAKQESTQGTSSSGAAQTYTCRSGMVTSKPGFNFTYGLIQISAKLPYGPGLWPALWLAATNDQWPPELDIMEHWYSEPQMKVYDHTIGTKYLGGPVPTPADLSAGFHTYSLLWTKDRVTWYLDGTQVFTTTSYVPQQAMYFIANVADDSTAAGACTGTMRIQSVKVYQP